MATIAVIDEKTIKISVDIEDALSMIAEAESNPELYAAEILMIAEKMPEFQYTYFCFYAYDTAMLFEKMLGIDPKQYLSFSLDAPDSFFYTLYGGMKGLSVIARRLSSPSEDRDEAKNTGGENGMNSDNNSRGGIVELDVRPQLLAGEEPFSIIMETFGTLQPGETFVLHATMKPAPLIPLLEGKGYTSTCEQLSSEHWTVTFVPQSN